MTLVGGLRHVVRLLAYGPCGNCCLSFNLPQDLTDCGFTTQQEIIMKRLPSNALATVLFTVVAAASLAACDRAGDERSAGQKLDGAVEQVQRTTDEVKADARAAGQEAKAATETAVEAIADKSKDAVITTTINAELAKDTQLSALRVDVDTADGRVILRGTAPDTASRERATELAQRVEGVKSVDNQLSVGPKG